MTADIHAAARQHVDGQVSDYARDWFADGAVWAAARVTPTREQIAEVLRGIGLTDEPDKYDSSIHSWRCGHTEIYGRCSCFDDAVNDLAALMAGLAEGEHDGSDS